MNLLLWYSWTLVGNRSPFYYKDTYIEPVKKRRRETLAFAAICTLAVQAFFTYALQKVAIDNAGPCDEPCSDSSTDNECF